MFDAIMLFILSLVTAIIGTWLYMAENKGIVCFLLSVVFFVCGALSANTEIENKSKQEAEKYNELIEQKEQEFQEFAMQQMLECSDEIKRKDEEINKLKMQHEKLTTFWTDTYYAPAEIVSQKKTNDDTYNIVFCIDVLYKYKYEWISDYEYPDDIPYLLTMDGNGTTEFTDDKVLVVWGDMN